MVHSIVTAASSTHLDSEGADAVLGAVLDELNILGRAVRAKLT